MKEEIVLQEKINLTSIIENHELVAIKWVDSAVHGTSEYNPDDTELKHVTGISVGILVRADEDSITIALDYFDTGNYRNCETIHMKQILEYKKF